MSGRWSFLCLRGSLSLVVCIHPSFSHSHFLRKLSRYKRDLSIFRPISLSFYRPFVTALTHSHIFWHRYKFLINEVKRLLHFSTCFVFYYSFFSKFLYIYVTQFIVQFYSSFSFCLVLVKTLSSLSLALLP